MRAVRNLFGRACEQDECTQQHKTLGEETAAFPYNITRHLTVPSSLAAGDPRCTNTSVMAALSSGRGAHRDDHVPTRQHRATTGHPRPASRVLASQTYRLGPLRPRVPFVGLSSWQVCSWTGAGRGALCPADILSWRHRIPSKIEVSSGQTSSSCWPHGPWRCCEDQRYPERSTYCN